MIITSEGFLEMNVMMAAFPALSLEFWKYRKIPNKRPGRF